MRTASWLAASVLLLAPLTSATAADPDLRLEWTVDADRDRIAVVIDNTTAEPLPEWDVTVPFSHLVTDVDGAISVQEDDWLTLSGNGPLGPGAEHIITLQVSELGDASWSPTSCTTMVGRCLVVSTAALADQDPTPEPKPEPSPTQSSTAPASPSPDPSNEAVPSPTTSIPAVPGGSLRLSYRVLADWGERQSVVVAVTNTGPAATEDWQVTVPADVVVTEMWNAVSWSGGGSVRAGNTRWNGYLAPGESLEFGFIASPGGSAPWVGCEARVDGLPVPCEIQPATSWVAYPELPAQW